MVTFKFVSDLPVDITEKLRLQEVMKNRLKLAKLEADLGHTNWMSDYDA